MTLIDILLFEHNGYRREGEKGGQEREGKRGRFFADPKGTRPHKGSRREQDPYDLNKI